MCRKLIFSKYEQLANKFDLIGKDLSADPKASDDQRPSLNGLINSRRKTKNSLNVQHKDGSVNYLFSDAILHSTYSQSILGGEFTYRSWNQFI